jgi:hypothetical protein
MRIGARVKPICGVKVLTSVLSGQDLGNLKS